MIETDRALADRALAAQRAGRAAEAESLWRHLLAVDPADATASFHLGVLLANQGRLDDAARHFSHVLALVPSAAEAAGNLGFVYQRLGQLENAVELYRRALVMRPDLDVVRNNYASVLQELGCIDEALGAFRTLADSDDPRLAANLLTALNLMPGTLAEHKTAARAWAARFADPLMPARVDVRDDPAMRLRVGYVGADALRRHTLAMTWLPLIEAHDPRAVEVIVYSDLPQEREDDMSRRFQAVATWCRTRDLDDDAFAAQVRADGIDILVDGLGFAAGMRLLAFARRPAPIQIHFPPMSTTGMTAMDYIIADERLIPDAAARFFTERIWRLPCGFLYQPAEPLPDPATIARPRAAITFGSFNRLAKIGPPVIAAWGRILTAVPAARLILKTGGHLTPDMTRRYEGLFAAVGIARARLEFRGRVSDAEHFRQFHDIDIMLDPFPYGGVLTTCDALAMGVPVVTLAGERILERYGAALLSATGFIEGMAADVDDYVARAAALARNPDTLRAERAVRSRRVRTSPLCDAPAFARALEDAYRAMWRERRVAP